MPKRGAEQGEPSKPNPSSNMSDVDGLSPNPTIPSGECPGLTGLMLSGIKEHLRDLGTDSTCPEQERENLRLFYTRERSRLELQLSVLEKTERLNSCERVLKEAKGALDFARSEGGREDARREWKARAAGNSPGCASSNPPGLSSLPDNAGGDEIRKSEAQYSLAETRLINTRSEVKAASAEFARLRAPDVGWKEMETSAKRWELSRGWKAITPAELQPAVEAIRHTFEHYGCWRSKESTRKLCFAALHPAFSNDSGRPEVRSPDPYKRFLRATLGPRVNGFLLDATHPEPAIFKSYLEVLEAALKIALRASFKELFEIAQARIDGIAMHPVEWARRHSEILISEEQLGIRLWIKEICDPLPSPRSDSTDDEIFWGSWRAPRLIHMEPAGSTPYERATAWTREQLVRSEELVEARTVRFGDFLRIELEEIARSAHVQYAKQDNVRVRIPNHRGMSARTTSPPVTGKQPPDVWRSLHETFSALAEDEMRLAPRNSGDRWLRAYVDYKDGTIPCGQWHLSEGVNESFRELFEVEATRAGIALRSSVSGEAGDVWLHHVFSDLLLRNSKLLFSASKEGGTVVRVCEASALYCARLEKQALIESRKRLAETDVQTPVVGSALTSLDDLRKKTFREAVVKKVQNPNVYTFLSTPEAAAYFEVEPRTIHRWTADGDLRRGARRGSITIESILRLEKSRSRRRQNR